MRKVLRGKITLALTRPGQTAWTLQRRFEGQASIPLNGGGWRQVRRLTAKLNRKCTSQRIIVSSDLPRARQTAESIGKVARFSSAWRALDMGDWTGMTYEEIVRSSDGQLFRRWYDDPWTLAPPNGETLKEVAARIRRGLRDLLRLVASLESGSMSESSFRAPLVCLVAHKTPLKAVQSMLSGNELKLADESSSCVENGSYLLQSTTVLRLRLSSAAAVQNGIPPEHRSTLLQG